MTTLDQELKKEYEKEFLSGSMGSMVKVEFLLRDGNAWLMEKIWIWITNVYGKRVREEVVKDMRSVLIRIPEDTLITGFEDKSPSGKTWIHWFLNYYQSLRKLNSKNFAKIKPLSPTQKEEKKYV